MPQLFQRKPIADLVQETEGSQALKRSLGAGDLIMLSIGAVIGAGIFGAIGTAAAGQLGPNGEVTSGDNEGTWVPVCPIHWVKPGSFNGVVDGAHRPLHSAKGAEKEISESGFFAMPWKMLSAFMSQGAASPVS